MSERDEAAGPLPIYPIILAGGAADGLWPLSRHRFPWQFRKSGRGGSPLQHLLRWCQRAEGLAAPTVMSHFDYRFIVSEQCAEAGILPFGIVLEPERRGSGPSALAAAVMMAIREPDAVLLFLPAELPMNPDAPLMAVLRRARAAADAGRFVLLADEARSEGEYLLTSGEPLDKQGTLFALADGQAAADGTGAGKKKGKAKDDGKGADAAAWPYAGMAVARAATVVKECRARYPLLTRQMEHAVRTGGVDLTFYRLGKTAFTAAEPCRLSDILMSAGNRAAVAPCTLNLRYSREWAQEIAVRAHNNQGNTLQGDIVAVDVENSYVLSEDRLVGAVGLRNTLIVDTPDALLVADRERLDEVPQLLNALREKRRSELDEHRTAFRPWGQIAALGAGEHYDIKLLTLRPGAAIALQLHHHRAKHWVVLEGTARVRRGDRRLILSPNQSAFIPIGMPHAVANPGKLPLKMVQVQSGDYFGRDDVVRLEEPYRGAEETLSTLPPEGAEAEATAAETTEAETAAAEASGGTGGETPVSGGDPGASPVTAGAGSGEERKPAGGDRPRGKRPEQA